MLKIIPRECIYQAIIFMLYIENEYVYIIIPNLYISNPKRSPLVYLFRFDTMKNRCDSKCCNIIPPIIVCHCCWAFEAQNLDRVKFVSYMLQAIRNSPCRDQ